MDEINHDGDDISDRLWSSVCCCGLIQASKSQKKRATKSSQEGVGCRYIFTTRRGSPS